MAIGVVGGEREKEEDDGERFRGQAQAPASADAAAGGESCSEVRQHNLQGAAGAVLDQ